MKYINAAEILPEELLKEIQTYIDGGVLYIPKTSVKRDGGQPVVHENFIKKEIMKYIFFLKTDTL